MNPASSSARTDLLWSDKWSLYYVLHSMCWTNKREQQSNLDLPKLVYSTRMTRTTVAACQT